MNLIHKALNRRQARRRAHRGPVQRDAVRINRIRAPHKAARLHDQVDDVNANAGAACAARKSQQVC